MNRLFFLSRAFQRKRRVTDNAIDLAKENLLNNGAFLEFWAKLLGHSCQQKNERVKSESHLVSEKEKATGCKFIGWLTCLS